MTSLLYRHFGSQGAVGSLLTISDNSAALLNKTRCSLRSTVIPLLIQNNKQFLLSFCMFTKFGESPGIVKHNFISDLLLIFVHALGVSFVPDSHNGSLKNPLGLFDWQVKKSRGFLHPQLKSEIVIHRSSRIAV